MADSSRDNLPARPFPKQGFLGANGGNVPEYAPSVSYLPTIAIGIVSLRMTENWTHRDPPLALFLPRPTSSPRQPAHQPVLMG